MSVPLSLLYRKVRKLPKIKCQNIGESADHTQIMILICFVLKARTYVQSLKTKS